MPGNPNKISLEQLLQLKKAEQPDPAFWDKFQKEFRLRQLQTLIEKASVWSRLPQLLFARSSLWVPLSSAAMVLFVLLVNFRDKSQLQSEYIETVAIASAVAEPIVEPLVSKPVIEPEIGKKVVVTPAISSAPASFIVDVIPAKLPEARTYTHEFPTSTIRSKSTALATYVSYTISRDTPSFASANRSQSIGF